eukprot:TRINITY_DN2201_c0_g1_i1.p1 TRINITY_DN2201_c0_g1~~TRINITY_DN2201_c0_g1_i1.p1  ORF type:complete len:708 (+),score=151.73 TRINITY_DN2201_c0_g1_i1:35-2125(+)
MAAAAAAAEPQEPAPEHPQPWVFYVADGDTVYAPGSMAEFGPPMRGGGSAAPAATGGSAAGPADPLEQAVATATPLQEPPRRGDGLLWVHNDGHRSGRCEVVTATGETARGARGQPRLVRVLAVRRSLATASTPELHYVKPGDLRKPGCPLPHQGGYFVRDTAAERGPSVWDYFAAMRGPGPVEVLAAASELTLYVEAMHKGQTEHWQWMGPASTSLSQLTHGALISRDVGGRGYILEHEDGIYCTNTDGGKTLEELGLCRGDKVSIYFDWDGAAADRNGKPHPPLYRKGKRRREAAGWLPSLPGWGRPARIAPWGSQTGDQPAEAVVDDDAVCAICLCEGSDGNPLIDPCQCRGSIRYRHHECLRAWVRRRLWLGDSHNSAMKCTVCNRKYRHRMKPPRLRQRLVRRLQACVPQPAGLPGLFFVVMALFCFMSIPAEWEACSSRQKVQETKMQREEWFRQSDWSRKGWGNFIFSSAVGLPLVVAETFFEHTGAGKYGRDIVEQSMRDLRNAGMTPESLAVTLEKRGFSFYDICKTLGIPTVMRFADFLGPETRKWAEGLYGWEVSRRGLPLPAHRHTFANGTWQAWCWDWGSYFHGIDQWVNGFAFARAGPEDDAEAERREREAEEALRRECRELGSQLQSVVHHECVWTAHTELLMLMGGVFHFMGWLLWRPRHAVAQAYVEDIVFQSATRGGQ